MAAERCRGRTRGSGASLALFVGAAFFVGCIVPPIPPPFRIRRRQLSTPIGIPPPRKHGRLNPVISGIPQGFSSSVSVSSDSEEVTRRPEGTRPPRLPEGLEGIREGSGDSDGATYEDYKAKDLTQWRDIHIPEDLLMYKSDEQLLALETNYTRSKRDKWVIRRISDTLKSAVGICQNLDEQKKVEKNSLVDGLSEQLQSIAISDPSDAFNKPVWGEMPGKQTEKKVITETPGDDEETIETPKVDRSTIQIAIDTQNILEALREDHGYKALDDEYLELEQEDIWGPVESRKRMKILLQKAQYIKWKLDTTKWWREAQVYCKKKNTTIFKEYGIEGNMTSYIQRMYKNTSTTTPNNNMEIDKNSNSSSSALGVPPKADQNTKPEQLQLKLEAKEMLRRLVSIERYVKKTHNYEDLAYEIQILIEDIGEEFSNGIIAPEVLSEYKAQTFELESQSRADVT